MAKIHVYFMPGLAASSSIFNRIRLDESLFEVHLLEWIMPQVNETLKNYSKRLSKKISHEDAVLIGVSFGGILVQEMKDIVNARETIIISSVKSSNELPRRMKIAKATKAYKLLPTSLLENVEHLVKYTFGSKIIRKKIMLYQQFLFMRNKRYLDWAIEQVVTWDRKEIDQSVIHIHGDADEVFPIKHINNCIVVKDGTHAMILTKYQWLNKNLPKIILENL